MKLFFLKCPFHSSFILQSKRIKDNQGFIVNEKTKKEDFLKNSPSKNNNNWLKWINHFFES